MFAAVNRRQTLSSDLSRLVWEKRAGWDAACREQTCAFLQVCVQASWRNIAQHDIIQSCLFVCLLICLSAFAFCLCVCLTVCLLACGVWIRTLSNNHEQMHEQMHEQPGKERASERASEHAHRTCKQAGRQANINTQQNTNPSNPRASQAQTNIHFPHQVLARTLVLQDDGPDPCVAFFPTCLPACLPFACLLACFHE